MQKLKFSQKQLKSEILFRVTLVIFLIKDLKKNIGKTTDWPGTRYEILNGSQNQKPI